MRSRRRGGEEKKKFVVRTLNASKASLFTNIVVKELQNTSSTYSGQEDITKTNQKNDYGSQVDSC